jgi:hypothetical protein
MPIVGTDIQYRLSGGAANAVPNASIGGAKSSVSVVDATLHNLFDVVSSAEALSGDVEYRCFYVHNAHATLTLTAAKIWIQTQTPDTETSADIGLAAAAVNATETAVANENTAPAGGVTFSAPANEGAALVIGDIPAGQHKAIWVRRTVNAAAAAYNTDSVIIRVKGDTAA